MFPLHRVFQAIRPETLLLLRMAADTGTLLRIIRRILVGIVRLLPDHHTVHHINFIHAASAAVVPAGGVFPLASLFQIHNRRMFGRRFRRSLRRGSRRRRSGALRRGRRRRRSRRTFF